MGGRTLCVLRDTAGSSHPAPGCNPGPPDTAPGALRSLHLGPRRAFRMVRETLSPSCVPSRLELVVWKEFKQKNLTTKLPRTTLGNKRTLSHSTQARHRCELARARILQFYNKLPRTTLWAREAAVPVEGEAESRPQPRKRHQKRLQRQSGNARKASKGPGRAEGSPRQAKEGTLGPESGGRT